MVKPRDLMIYVAAPLLLVAMLFLMSAGGSVSSTKGFEWYFNPNNEHRQPTVIADVPLEGERVLYCGNEQEKKVSITFDAGYENGHTAAILDVLKEKGVSGAFFLDGNYLKQNGELVQRMAKEGHLVGNHTLHHADMTALTDLSAYRAEVEGWNDLLAGLGLHPSGYFRFPCGKFSARALEYNRQLGLTSVFWTFAYYDWVQDQQPAPDAALEKIMSRMHNGCILLLHSTSATNAAILGTLIDRLRAEGYEIVGLSEIDQ